MTSSGSPSVAVALAVIPRRARRRRASLTLYGRPLCATHDHTAPRQPAQPEAPSTNHTLADSMLDADADRDADALRETIRRLQAEARRDATLSRLVPALDLDRVVASTVTELWYDSPIKTFVPVLALRLTRELVLSGSQE